MKRKVLVAALVFVLILGGCGSPKVEVMELPTPDLTTEEGIKEYLVGDWVFDQEHLSEYICNMSIDEDLNLSLSFEDPYGQWPKEDLTGKISLNRQYASPGEAPDVLGFDIVEMDWPEGEGDYFFLHRTAYDGKFVMSLFFAGNGDGIFGKLDPYDSYGPPEEIVFEKEVEGETQLQPRINDEFHAVFWGGGYNGESLWLDDVDWEYKDYNGETIMIDGEEWLLEDWDKFNAAYPASMTEYENEVKESVPYTISSDENTVIGKGELFPGAVCYVKTDENGHVTSLIEAEYNVSVLGDSEGRTPSGDEALALEILKNDYYEVKEYLSTGLELFFTGKIYTLYGEEYYEVILGEHGEDGNLWTEKTYAVDINTGQVYYFDVYTDDFEELGAG